MWSHFTIQFSGTVFAMTWGYPFLISGQGLDAGTVAALMALYVAAAMAVGPVHWPLRVPAPAAAFHHGPADCRVRRRPPGRRCC